MVMHIEIGEERDASHYLTARRIEAFAAKALKRKPSEAACGFMECCSLAELAHDSLVRINADRGLAQHDSGARCIEVALSHTRSDFPLVVGNLLGKMLLPDYEAARPAYRKIGLQTSYGDFNEHRLYRGIDFPRPLEVGEHGEVSAGTLADSGEVGQLANYARRFPLSRQTLINDDAGYFASMARAGARSCVDIEDSIAFGLLTSASGAGPTLADGTALFHANRGNLAGSGGAISTTTIGALRATMMGAESPGGAKSTAVPRYLVASAATITTAETELAKMNPGTAPAWRIVPVPAVNLSGNGWYLFASPNESPVLTYGYLAGSTGPNVTVARHWETDGLEALVSLDFAAAICDWRGAARNPGA